MSLKKHTRLTQNNEDGLIHLELLIAQRMVEDSNTIVRLNSFTGPHSDLYLARPD